MSVKSILPSLFKSADFGKFVFLYQKDNTLRSEILTLLSLLKNCQSKKVIPIAPAIAFVAKSKIVGPITLTNAFSDGRIRGQHIKDFDMSAIDASQQDWFADQIINNMSTNDVRQVSRGKKRVSFEHIKNRVQARGGEGSSDQQVADLAKAIRKTKTPPSTQQPVTPQPTQPSVPTPPTP